MNLFPPTDNTLLYFLRHTLDVVQVTFSLGITPGAATQVQQPLHFLRGREKLTCTNPSTESAPQCCPPTRGAIGPARPCPPSTAVAAAATSGGSSGACLILLLHLFSNSEAKGKGGSERYTHLNAEFQRGEIRSS